MSTTQIHIATLHNDSEPSRNRDIFPLKNYATISKSKVTKPLKNAAS
jgi:hypothetical protein